ncbi:helix-turn-helix transcriptional regulator [Defluviimonas aestuarii]|uniref:helix-turn-helix domain-containing protein n=1 Tax=Albidovulum aestuarii TaxID=1130726 RepID=UPI00249BF782|nr:helix-turn-helix transcriptional regulator [Defluviimonas aestuarii]MDI3335890.1 helix-turn-helix transcriptional regulator [Defluviimonas aestuarii]
MNDRTFADRLKWVIDNDPDLTEAGLAVKAGLANSTVRKLLAGTVQNPRMDTAKKICAALGTTVDQFMKPDLTPEEREIIRLTALLPDHLRRQVLGFVQGVAAGLDLPPQESGEEG